MGFSLVVPSNRVERLGEFFEAWEVWEPGRWQRVFLIEDSPQRTFRPVPEQTRWYCWSDIEADLGEDHWIFSRRDSAIRSYGFYRAWLEGSFDDVIITLDDDCRPVGSVREFQRRHADNLRRPPRWVSSVDKRVRGLPYETRLQGGELDVWFSMGLWSGVADQDAVQQLGDDWGTDYTPPAGTWLLHPQQLSPICGMNLAFARHAAPLAYFPKMGLDSPYSRFDDIWFGVVAQVVCRQLGKALSVGEPWVHHTKASNPYRNLEREAPGLTVNEEFWRWVDVPLQGRTLSEVLDSLLSQLAARDLLADPDYGRQFVRAWRRWLQLFARES